MKLIKKIISFIKSFFSKKPKIKEQYIPDFSNINLSNSEIILLDKINLLRVNSNVKDVYQEVFLSKMAGNRVDYSISVGKATHNQIGDSIYPLKDKGFINIKENIGSGYYNAESMYNSFFRSPEHYENMVDPNHKYIGISIKQDINNVNYVCVLFADKYE